MMEQIVQRSGYGLDDPRSLPGEEDDLVAGTVGQSVVKVVDGVAAVTLGELKHKVVVGGGGLRSLLNLDRLVVLRELVDDVLVDLLKLQLLERDKALRVDTDSGRLYKEKLCKKKWVSLMFALYIGLSACHLVRCF